jgi:hypothetical protein
MYILMSHVAAVCVLRALFPLLFFTHVPALGLSGHEHGLAAAPQASAHIQRVVLHGLGSAEPCRSCLCLFTACPPSPTMDFWSQVRPARDTELEEWSRDRSCAQSTGTHSAACPVCVASLCLTLQLFVCGVLFSPCFFHSHTRFRAYRDRKRCSCRTACTSASSTCPSTRLSACQALMQLSVPIHTVFVGPSMRLLVTGKTQSRYFCGRLEQRQVLCKQQLHTHCTLS